ncbi:helix-turn-helix transcriptional regulator [Streptomyces sp. FH025]|uniref:helix-turn-helix domain-containing protein n=1 Tax=Streptomyces sp. FH025 TaxID=2815937 RepID=UPI001A9ECF4E|nr:helix-turn-helix transcriptional regulator [Streptomyces sp. FH025]MBO1417815.1 helix-turn-helix domain-containing protein [Streptomyces sp. FH025]
MALRTEISERQRRFGVELRRLREEAGFTVKDAGALIDMGAPQLSHIEASRTGLDPARLSNLLTRYGCTDETYMAELGDLGASDGKGWWSTFKDQVTPRALDLAETEARAASLDNYETFYIPGYLQLPEYTEAMFEDAYPERRQATDAAVRFRIERQRILTDERQRQFRFVIHEAALLMHFPGKAVMRAQLKHLLAISELPNITVQVLPFTVPKKPPRANSFLICAPSSAPLSTVILDGPTRAEYLVDQASIASYRDRFEQLSQIALPAITADRSMQDDSRDSWGLIQHLLYLLQE